MMGRSHALSAAAAWIWVAPAFGVDTEMTLAGSSLLAAGAGVLPDLDHPDAYPSRQFGLLSRGVSKLVRGASGGHRQGTHSLLFAVFVGGLLWAADYWSIGSQGGLAITSAVLAAFIATVGVSLTAPSFGVRASPLAAMAAGGALGYWVWTQAPVEWMPPLLTIGIGVHILGDWLTKSGVPLLAPIIDRRWAAGLFRTGGRAEGFLAVGFLAAALLGIWRFLQ